MKLLAPALLAAALAVTACESASEKCKKACYDKVKVCESKSEGPERLACEVTETPLAIACASACAK